MRWSLIARKTRSAVYFKQWQVWNNPSDHITVGRDDFLLDAPWTLVLDCPHPIHDAFCELGFIRQDDLPRKSSPESAPEIFE